MTNKSKKAIFLDRDDTLIEDPGYINDPAQVKLLNGAAQALIDLKAMGYKLVVITNQSGVARGIVTEKVLEKIHERLKYLLTMKSVSLDGIYYCPCHPDAAIEKYRKESEMRKPNPGMILTAADELNIDLSKSWMIGNSGHDVEAGSRAGCKTILINHPGIFKESEKSNVKPNCTAVNIKEAVNIIKKHNRSASTKQTYDKLPAIPKPEPVKDNPPQTEPIQPSSSNDKTAQLLTGILDQLKRTHRQGKFDDFSTMRLLAGIVQMLVLLCLLISVGFLMSPAGTRKDSTIFIAIGFAVVFQLMALTFYTMQNRK
ncbi:D-glycero-alpha-D-manno-heptose-1,7-bisphosphate 7-phosphatase [Planctomycetota bacterium]